MRRLTVHRYSDPGHSWLRVRKSVLAELNLLDKISSYSYERKDHVYLEEDNDENLFVETLKSKGIKLSIYKTVHHTNKQSKIRTYSSYNYVAPVVASIPEATA